MGTKHPKMIEMRVIKDKTIKKSIKKRKLSLSSINYE